MAEVKPSEADQASGEPTKWCPRCEKDKPIGEFGINRARYDGRKSYCIPCQAAYSSAHPRPLKPRKPKPDPGPAPETLICTKCGKEKPIGEFPPEPRAKWGRRKQCRKCRLEAQTAAVVKRGPRPVSVEKKECARCGRTKEAKAFSPDNRQPDGLQSTCLGCYADEDAIRREIDPEYRARKIASCAASQAKYADQYQAKAQETKQNRTPEQVAAEAAADHAYYEAHKEELNQYSRAHYQANIEGERAAAKVRNRRNYLANPQAAIDRADQRRARMRGNAWEKINRKGIYERDGWRCGICGGKVNRREAWPEPGSPSLDHIIPIAHDGPHLATNVRLAHLRCNIGRGARLGLAGDQLLLIG